jgi:hypothetical protein
MLARELPDTPSTRTAVNEDSITNLVNGDSVGMESKLCSNSIYLSGSDGFRTASQALEAASAIIEQTKRIDEEYSVSARLTTVGAKVSSTTIATIQTAKQLEEDYHITQNVTESVKASVATAQKIEEDYHVTQKVASAARDAARLAAEYEERYQIQQTMKNLVSDGWMAVKAMSAQAIEYDRRYQLSQRAGAAMMDGLASAAEIAREASRAQWSYLGPKPAQSDPSATLPANASV